MDFIEREKEYVLRADIPGVHKARAHWARGRAGARALSKPDPSPALLLR